MRTSTGAEPTGAGHAMCSVGAEMTGPSRIDSTLFADGRSRVVAPARSGVLIDANDYYRAVATAIEGAERFILITGWQLDTRVTLRRRPGEDREDNSLAALLRRATERHPALHVAVLPWNFNPVYTLDREAQTDAKLEAIAPGRVHCVWDSDHVPGASQHEKVVIVDGDLAFLGGIDLCDHRWDDRHHLVIDPRRHDLNGEPCGPYHDVQAVVRGPVVAELVTGFAERWRDAGGAELPAPLTPSRAPREWPRFPNELPLTSERVAISRTRGGHADGSGPREAQIRDLFIEAIHRAERTIYIETQYFTSRALVDALARRFEDTTRPRLEVVMVLPRRCEGVLEQAAVQGPQRSALVYLSQIAARTGHALGVFCPGAEPCAGEAEDEGRVITYVHSKLVIVDDRFLTIGSANLTNRSMGVDSEVNLSWVAEREEDERTIAAVRISLLAEHAGLSEEDGVATFGATTELLPLLVHLATMKESRLVPHSFASHHATGETSEVEDLLADIGDPERVEGYEERVKSLGARLVALVRGAA